MLARVHSPRQIGNPVANLKQLDRTLVQAQGFIDGNRALLSKLPSILSDAENYLTGLARAAGH